MDKLRMGVIGCGGISQLSHLPAYLKIPEVELIAVSDSAPGKAEEAGRKFGAKRFYENYMDLLADPEVDAVDICTPVFLHHEMVMNAAKAKKHIICEKPVAMNTVQVQEMIDACKKNNVQFSIMFQQRYIPLNQYIKQALVENKIGSINMARGRTAHSGPDVRMAVPGSQMGSWVFSKEKSGGGVLFDIGVHILDLMTWFLGEVESVSAQVGTLTRDVEVEDNAILLLKFKQGTMGVVDASWSQQIGFNFREFYGTEGSIVTGMENNVVSIGSKDSWEKRSFEPRDWWFWHHNVLQDFAQAILAGKQTPITGNDGLRSLQIIEAAFESMKTGSTIKLN